MFCRIKSLRQFQHSRNQKCATKNILSKNSNVELNIEIADIHLHPSFSC